MLVPMIVARSGAERGNNEWLEKLQCSSGVPMIVKSVPLRSIGTGNCSSACTNDCGTEQSGEIMNGLRNCNVQVVFPISVKSVPLRSVATGKCTNDCGTERSEIAHLFPVNIAPRMLKERSGE